MKTGKLIDMLKKGSFVVPLYLFQLRDNFNVDLKEFMLLIYLTNLGEKIPFDANKYAEDLNMSVNEVLSCIDDLAEKKYISIDVLKNDKNVMDEYINLELLYGKLSTMVIDDINTKENTDNSNIFSAIEKEFARPLTPVEFEIIHAWIEEGTSEEIILEALKEAVYSGVPNLRYIDKIIYTWNKNNIKTKEDVEKNRKNFKSKQEKKEKLELFDYDWFEDGEDE